MNKQWQTFPDSFLRKCHIYIYPQNAAFFRSTIISHYVPKTLIHGRWGHIHWQNLVEFRDLKLERRIFKTKTITRHFQRVTKTMLVRNLKYYTSQLHKISFMLHTIWKSTSFLSLKSIYNFYLHNYILIEFLGNFLVWHITIQK